MTYIPITSVNNIYLIFSGLYPYSIRTLYNLAMTKFGSATDCMSADTTVEA